MTVSEASVGDFIVLTYDVTACMCVHVHASVLVCVPVRVTFCVFLFFLGMLNLIIIYFSSFCLDQTRSTSSALESLRVHIKL